MLVNLYLELRMIFENENRVFFEEGRKHIEIAFIINALYSDIWFGNIDGARARNFFYFGSYRFSDELNHCVSISGPLIID